MPFLMRGAMIEYGSDFLGPLPNVVIFQFNPESLSRTIQIPPRPTGAAARETTQAGEPSIEKITLKAQPTISMAPSRVVLTAELTGGANDYEEYYCPTVEWDWGDGTQSESTIDCEPFQAGKSEIKRRYTVEHIFRTGAYKVMFRLKRRDKALAAATVSIQVRPGLREGGM